MSLPESSWLENKYFPSSFWCLAWLDFPHLNYVSKKPLHFLNNNNKNFMQHFQLAVDAFVLAEFIATHIFQYLNIYWGWEADSLFNYWTSNFLRLIKLLKLRLSAGGMRMLHLSDNPSSAGLPVAVTLLPMKAVPFSCLADCTLRRALQNQIWSPCSLNPPKPTALVSFKVLVLI